ncbi:isoflavone reductase homolog [Syzygium oleosum]|uniref:isoflavone reductase homolog n=1 Tax=Syzygium oleosum TaxID=219896 RepID=UPI0024B939C2|nr:isoflavone reductase homolog [Syzygium oleosum]
MSFFINQIVKEQHLFCNFYLVIRESVWDCIALAAVFLDEDDIATYAIKTIDDLRTLNKTVYLRPPENVLYQRQLVEMWEKLSGRTLEKRSVSAEDSLASMKGLGSAEQVGVGHFYHIF